MLFSVEPRTPPFFLGGGVLTLHKEYSNSLFKAPMTEWDLTPNPKFYQVHFLLLQMLHHVSLHFSQSSNDKTMRWTNRLVYLV